MTTQDLTKMLVFLLGLWLLPQVLAQLVSLPPLIDDLMLSKPDESGALFRAYRISFLIFCFCNLLFVTSLVFTPGWWARLIFSGARNVELPRLSELAFQSVIYSLVGLGLLITAIVDTPQILTEWKFQPEATVPEQVRDQLLRYLPGRASVFFRYLIGIWLLIGANGVVHFVQHLRSAGRDRGAAKSPDRAGS